MSESTPLINPSSGGGGAASSYYFLQGGNKQDGETSFDASIRDGPTGETVEQLPEGTTGDEFASRPVMVSHPSAAVMRIYLELMREDIHTKVQIMLERIIRVG